MKKFLSVLLTFCLVFAMVNTSVLAAEWTDISLTEDNLGRGKTAVGAVVVPHEDGTITSTTANISFYLPEAIAKDEVITVHITGSSDGDFRVWLIDVNETTNSDIYQMSANDFTSGEFDTTFTLTATAEATELFFKAPTFDSKINNLTLTSISITKGAIDEQVVETEDTTSTDTTTDGKVGATTDSTPKTSDNVNITMYIVIMVVVTTGLVVLKKRKVMN